MIYRKIRYILSHWLIRCITVSSPLSLYLIHFRILLQWPNCMPLNISRQNIFGESTDSSTWIHSPTAILISSSKCICIHWSCVPICSAMIHKYPTIAFYMLQSIHRIRIWSIHRKIRNISWSKDENISFSVSSVFDSFFECTWSQLTWSIQEFTIVV